MQTLSLLLPARALWSQPPDFLQIFFLSPLGIPIQLGQGAEAAVSFSQGIAAFGFQDAHLHFKTICKHFFSPPHLALLSLLLPL